MQTLYAYAGIMHYYTVKCRCNERQYNEMFRIAKLFLGPFPFPYLMRVKTFHFNEFRTFSITNLNFAFLPIFNFIFSKYNCNSSCFII